jgi:hypothetical protein
MTVLKNIPEEEFFEQWKYGVTESSAAQEDHF